MLSLLLPPRATGVPPAGSPRESKAWALGSGQGSSQWGLLKGPSAFLPALRAQCTLGRVSVQGPLGRWGWGPAVPLRTPWLEAPLGCGSLWSNLTPPAAPCPPPGLFHHSEVLHCFRRRGRLSAPRPSPSPSWETSCCHLTLWCLSCRVCNAILAGKEECGLISAGMRPLGCPPRGEGTETKPARAQETQLDSGLGDRPPGPLSPAPTLQQRPCSRTGPTEGWVSQGAGEKEASWVKKGAGAGSASEGPA